MKFRKVLSILIIIVTIFTLTSCKKNIKRAYKDFGIISSEYCDIPGLDTNFVPQGIAYSENYKLILVAGYNSNETPSPIYVLDEKGNMLKKITFKLENGKDYNGHAGGIVVYNDLVFVSSGKKVYKLDINKIIDAKNNETINVDKTTKVDVSGATMFIVDNYLFVTEFYYPKKYETDPSHYVETSNGTNKALAFAYEIDELNLSGLKNNTPKCVISIPGSVQGMLIREDEIILSTSYGRFNDSYLYKYENILKKDTEKTYSYNNIELPLYVIDSKDLKEELLTPSMSEGICIKENKLLVLFESGAKKYKLTAKCSIDKIWQTDF